MVLLRGYPGEIRNDFYWAALEQLLTNFYA